MPPIRISSELWRERERRNIPFPRSAILTVIRSFPSNKLELEVSSPKLWLGFESTDIDNGVVSDTDTDTDTPLVVLVEEVDIEKEGAVVWVVVEEEGAIC